MSTATDLLNDLVEETCTAGTSPNEQHIVIGRDRYITVPDCLKKIAVQYDKDIETVTFDCPRYWDEHDLLTMQVFVNYIREDGELGSRTCTNVTAEDDIIHFDWTVGRHSTEVNGRLQFLICAKKTDEEGNLLNAWHSELNSDMYISEGRPCEDAVINQYPDIIIDLLTRMDVVEAASKTFLTNEDKTELQESISNLSGEIDDLKESGTGVEITDEQINSAVSSWLDAHPEATATVADGSITESKLADDVVGKFSNLSSEIENLKENGVSSDDKFETIYEFEEKTKDTALNGTANWVNIGRTSGYYIGENGQQIEDSASTFTDFYPVVGGSYIVYNRQTSVAVFDKNKEFIEYFAKPTANKTQVQLPDDAYFMVGNVHQAGVWTNWFFTDGSFEDVVIKVWYLWNGHHYTLGESVNLREGSVSVNNLSADLQPKVLASKFSVLEDTELVKEVVTLESPTYKINGNLVTADDVTAGYLDPLTNEVNSGSTGCYTKKILAAGGETLQLGQKLDVLFYDMYERYIGGYKSTGTETTVTLPDGARYYVLSQNWGISQFIESHAYVAAYTDKYVESHYYNVKDSGVTWEQVHGKELVDQAIVDTNELKKSWEENNENIKNAGVFAEAFECKKVIIPAGEIVPFNGDGIYFPYPMTSEAMGFSVRFYDENEQAISGTGYGSMVFRTDLNTLSTQKRCALFFEGNKVYARLFVSVTGTDIDFYKEPTDKDVNYAELDKVPTYIKTDWAFSYNEVFFEDVVGENDYSVIFKDNNKGLLDQMSDYSQGKTVQSLTQNDAFGRRLKAEIIRQTNEMRHAIRLGTFNVKGSGGFGQNNWYKLKECFENFAIDICGLQEVNFPLLNVAGNGTFAEYFKSWQFPYVSDNGDAYRKGDGEEHEGKNERMLLSRYHIDSTEEVFYTSAQNVNDGDYRYYAKSVVSLPRYMDKRGSENLKLSIYNTQLEVLGATITQAQAQELAQVAQADPNPFVIIMGDTNDFTLDKKTWKIFEEAGFTPVASMNTATVAGTYDFNCIDNFFLSKRVKALNHDVVWAQDYPWSGSEMLSDHDLVIADVELDYSDIRCINYKLKNCTVTTSTGRDWLTNEENVTVTITPNNGYTLSSVTVYDTMIKITDYAYSDGVVTLTGANLKGDVLIDATAS